MTTIDLGDFKLRFDPKEVRINIDGNLIDVGARRSDECDNLDDYEMPKGERLVVNMKKLSNYIIYHKTTGERIELDELMRRVDSQ